MGKALFFLGLVVFIVPLWWSSMLPYYGIKPSCAIAAGCGLLLMLAGVIVGLCGSFP